MNDVITADKVTSYGDRAVEQGKRVAEVPQQKGKGKTPPPAKVPAHVEAARSSGTSSLRKAWPNVVVHEMGTRRQGDPGQQLRGLDQLGDPDLRPGACGTNAAALYVVLHHEAEHIGQFRTPASHR